ncbi:PhnD/SsuA/transferrin family substrate-binding protein [Desulfotomaculum copahuensis]|uniref:Phosphonate ABC transporter substrate-binding protein n=1 Tax=Desulfotomaculum copahuensis TaxID=1838280 RepID=A0A1B7LH00_9FIRM|nr:PhnD/SsuA/transferrin family substrate-binding protein [Desulfotomaculum copahuensis]OAT85463.1 phosphonate ABC transporter substrate-binding protein [Desulfotomaculum copahuensis]
MRKLYFPGLIIALAVFLLAGCGSSSNAPSNSATVKEPDTITIAWLPNNSGENEKELRAEIDNVIAKATGKKVEDKLTTDYAIAIAALENGDAQLGWFGPNEYLVSHAKNPKIIPLVVESGDSGTLKDALYHSRFLVKKGNEAQYKSGDSYGIDNITGKRISFVSTSSTSGFNMPAAAIMSYFSKQDKWKHLTKDDLAQGGSGKFFSQVIFAGSHQLSLVSLLTDKVDVAAVDDIDVSQYVELAQGSDNAPGAVYTVKKDAAAPFNNLAGKQFVVIKSIPVLNTPIEANSAVLSQKTLDAITQALTSDQVTNDPKIFAPKGAKGAVFVQPHRFVKVDDAWYDPMRKVLGIGA